MPKSELRKKDFYLVAEPNPHGNVIPVYSNTPYTWLLSDNGFWVWLYWRTSPQGSVLGIKLELTPKNRPWFHIRIYKIPASVRKKLNLE